MGNNVRVCLIVCMVGIFVLLPVCMAAQPDPGATAPEEKDVWNSLEVAKLAASLSIPLLLAVIGYWFNRHLKEMELENQKSKEYRDEERQQKRDEIAAQQRREELERQITPRIEFTITCNFFGPHHGWYIAEFVVFARNTGMLQYKFRGITLKVRGIEKNDTPVLWEGHGERLKFSKSLLKVGLIPPDWNYIFVAPGVTQQISYISRIPEKIQYIVAHAEFEYDGYTPHNIERMFEVSAAAGQVQPLNAPVSSYPEKVAGAV